MICIKPMSGKAASKRKRTLSRHALRLNNVVNDGRYFRGIPTRGCPLGTVRNPFKLRSCIPNWALDSVEFTTEGEHLRSKIKRIQASRSARSKTAAGALRFSRRPHDAPCSMDPEQIHKLWNMLLLKPHASDTVCSSLEKSLILPSRPSRLINHGGYGTTLELVSGQVAKIVPVSTKPELTERYYPDITITFVHEAQYEAYMMHYVNKRSVVAVPRLFRFFMVQPRKSISNTVFNQWENSFAAMDPPLVNDEKTPMPLNNYLQLAIFIMSKARGEMLYAHFLKFATDEVKWVRGFYVRPSDESLNRLSTLLTAALDQIGMLHQSGIVHGDCHIKNILCSHALANEFDPSSDVLTFIDWARAMRRKDVATAQEWNDMCTYDFAQFLSSVNAVIGTHTYEALVKKSFYRLRDESEAKSIIRQRWSLYPGKMFDRLIGRMFQSLSHAQKSARENL